VHSISSTVLLAQLKVLGVKVYAAVAPEDSQRVGAGEGANAAATSVPPWSIGWKAPSAILIGNEGAGLTPDITRAADARVYIPQAASGAPVALESLNAAMAASVLLYEAMRQRDSLGKRAR
jgi:TrmH family RNA methyltransferase